MSPPDASTASPGPESAAGPKYKLITCILPKGAAMPVVEKLRAEMKITTANVGNTRGVGRLTPLAYRGVGEQTEKEVLTVAVCRGLRRTRSSSSSITRPTSTAPTAVSCTWGR